VRTLITGGAGFIGSHLAEQLIALGHSVSVLDDFSTGRPENVASLKQSPNFSLRVGSATDDRLVAAMVNDADVIFHLAAAVGVRLVVDRPVHTIETNVHGTETVLRHASKHGKLVLVASTSEVYGKSASLPFREDADLVLGQPSKTRWGYATSKLLDEFLAMAYWKERRSPVIVVRFFNTVGPRQSSRYGMVLPNFVKRALQGAPIVVRFFNTVGPRQSSRYGMVLPNFVKRALQGAPIVVHGDGTQTRSFTWVGDVVAAMIGLIGEPTAVGEVFNIGNGAEISIRDLAVKVRDMARSSSAIEFVPYEHVFDEGFEDMARRVPDISKIRRHIGYEPMVHLDEIIRRVIDFWSGDCESANSSAMAAAEARNAMPTVPAQFADTF
jgi:UDP-glucose 4-epimerase